MFEEEEIRNKGRQSNIRDNQKRSQSATLPRTANEAPGENSI